MQEIGRRQIAPGEPGCGISLYANLVVRNLKYLSLVTANAC